MNIKAVAAKAKVSTATISRTINQSGTVSPRTAEKVWRAIRELGYYPNTQARALVSGRSNMFGLIISDISNPFFPELVKSFEEAALRRNYEVIVANTDYQSDRMSACVRRMIERQVDGVAVMTSEYDPALLSEISRRQLPIVFLDLGSVKQRISDISVDYATGIREAVKHLLSLGHRRIGFISGKLDLKSARARRAAYLSCLKDAGLQQDAQLVVEGNHRVDGGQSAMSKLLSLKTRPTAVIASNDLSAIGALHAAFDKELSVPQDISIIGFDDIELSKFTQPPLTTIRLSRTELGERAFDALFRSVSGKSTMGEKIVINTSLVVRNSTAPVTSTRVKRAVG